MFQIMLSVEGLDAGYGGQLVLRQLSLNIRRGQICGLIGPNGAGKTTLFRAIYGLLPASGRVTMDGLALDGMSALQRRAAGMSYVPQERNVFPNLSVLENLELAYATHPATAGGASFQSRCEYIFELFPKLRERRSQLAGLMSGGEQRTVAIALGLIHEPRVLLLDEPTTGLAPIVVHQLMDTIQRLNKTRGVTTIIVEQNILSMTRIVDDLHVVKDGQCRAIEGGPKALNNQQIWEYL